MASDPKDEIDESVFDEKAAAAAFKAPPAPSSVLEALQQRLEKYKSAAEEAQREGNTSKARRMGRIQKQYEDAIKAHRAGKPVDFEELPTPPGFAPIPVSTSPVRTVPAAAGTRAISEVRFLNTLRETLIFLFFRNHNHIWIRSHRPKLTDVPLLLVQQRLQRKCRSRSKS